MPFKILQKTDATVDELGKAYVAIEIQKLELVEQKQTAYAEMVDCQQQTMGGDKSAPASLKKAKDAHQDLELQVDACADALGKIRARIEKELPGFTRQQITRLEKDREGLSKQAGKLRLEYLDLCGRAAVLNEQLKGPSFLHLGSGEMTLDAPGVNFDFSRLDTEDGQYFLKAVEKHRGGFLNHLKSGLDEIDSRCEKLENILIGGDFSSEAEKLLDSHRPIKKAEMEPGPEPGRPTSTARIVDYDKLRVEY